MLGAQAIRTKQKTKERKKKLSSAEVQCERIQKAAREDEEKFLEKVAQLHLADARAVSEIAEETKRRQQRRHHSVHEQLSTRLPSIDYSDHPRSFSKSSISFAKVIKPEGSSVDSVNIKETGSDKKLSKWCGLLGSSVGSGRQPSEKPPKRRMSFI